MNSASTVKRPPARRPWFGTVGATDAKGGGTDFDKYLSLVSVMPLLGYGSHLLSGAAVPSRSWSRVGAAWAAG